MIISVSCLGLICGVLTVSGSDLTCIGNTTCVNHEVCRDSGCTCPNSHYGANCEFSITNALIIVLICTLPPISWLAVCCYGVHSKGVSNLWPSRERGSSNEFERERDVEEDIIDDHPPPSYDQSLNYETAGTCEGVNVMSEGQGLEPPPSYLEWTRKAASLRNQEIDGSSSSIGLVTISDNYTMDSPVRSGDTEDEDQC